MKLTCSREKLWSSFQLAASVASSRSPKEILQNVRIDAIDGVVSLMATDMEVGIRIKVEGVEIHTPGRALLSVARVGPILRESSDDMLTLTTDDQGIVIQGSRSQFKLPSANPDEFPPVVPFEESSYHELTGRFLKEMIRRTAFATDTESSRYALGGVLLELQDEEVIAIGTDGRRLARMNGTGKSFGNHKTTGATTIVPTRALTLLERALNDKDESVCLAARANDILVKTDRFVIFSRLVEGRFPNWRMVFPKRDESTIIEGTVGPFYAAVRQASVVTDSDSRGLDFEFGNGSLILTGRAANIGQSRVEFPISYDGTAIRVTLDNRFVADFLRVLEPESNFHIELGTSSEAAVFKTDDGYSYVVMPMAR